MARWARANCPPAGQDEQLVDLQVFGDLEGLELILLMGDS